MEAGIEGHRETGDAKGRFGSIPPDIRNDPVAPVRGVFLSRVQDIRHCDRAL